MREDINVLQNRREGERQRLGQLADRERLLAGELAEHRPTRGIGEGPIGRIEGRMNFMIFVKSNPGIESSLASMSESALKESMAKMGAFNDELRNAGVLKDCDGLRPTKDGKRVRFDGEARRVVDGPFNGDLVAGYWLWELPSIEDAVAWVKRCPNPMPTEIEIRPIG